MMMMMNWINFESSLFSKFSLSPSSTSRSFSTHSSRSFFILFFCKYTSELVIIYNTVWIFKFLIRRDSEQVAKDFCGSSDVNIALIKVSPLRKRERDQARKGANESERNRMSEFFDRKQKWKTFLLQFPDTPSMILLNYYY